MVGCQLIKSQLTIGSQYSADTLIKVLINRLVDNPHETQDLEILLLAHKCKKGFLLITMSIYTAAG